MLSTKMENRHFQTYRTTWHCYDIQVHSQYTCLTDQGIDQLVFFNSYNELHMSWSYACHVQSDHITTCDYFKVS